jgi:hypothetical protein
MILYFMILECPLNGLQDGMLVCGGLRDTYGSYGLTQLLMDEVCGIYLNTWNRAIII